MAMFKIKPGMAIHCKTQEEANLLFDNTSLKFDKFFGDVTHHWCIYGRYTCYSFNQYEVWSYGPYDYYKEETNYEIIEFKDLIVTEKDLPSVVETIEKLGNKIFRDIKEKSVNMIMTEEEMDEQLEIYQELDESVCDRYVSVEEDEPMAEKNMSSREEMIQRIRDCGQYIIDNAESILGDEKYVRELYCTCNFFDRSEPPYVTITKDVIPDSFIERFR